MATKLDVNLNIAMLNTNTCVVSVYLQVTSIDAACHSSELEHCESGLIVSDQVLPCDDDAEQVVELCRVDV